MKRKIQLIGAFAALASLALAVSCRGFFVKPTLTSITISPSSPQAELNNTITLTVYGNYNDGSTGTVSSGITWTSESPTVANFTNSTSNVLSGLSIGTSVIEAQVQAVQATATASVYLAISSMTINPTTAGFSGQGGTIDFTVMAVDSTTGKNINITQYATLTAQQSGVQTTSITCAYDGVQFQVCTDVSAATGTYQIVSSFPPNTPTATATVSAP